MKIRLPLALIAVVFSAVESSGVAKATAPTDLGDVMYVGDSITHGVNSASYRWGLHKILVDNGIGYDAVGVKTGNYSGGVSNGTMYGNVAFENVHSSQASARAYHISGRTYNGGFFGGGNIKNWLGLDANMANGSAYTGTTFTGDDTPETFFLLIGTNDLLSDGNNATLNTRLETLTQTVLGDMDTIYDTMRTAYENANVVVVSIPCWTSHANGNSADTHTAVETYNVSLKNWAESKAGVTYVDVNKGMLDVASSTPFYGVSSMFNKPGSDGLHPSAQGDLIMAGNVAKAMGYAGRSAGQLRVASGDFSVNFHSGSSTPVWTGVEQLTAKGFGFTNVSVGADGIDLSADGTSTLSYSWGEDDSLIGGFTMDINLTLGDGSLNGWDTANDLSITLGTDSFCGTLNINEAYIKWGNTVIYSDDMSVNADAIRLAWLAGNNAEGLKTGYYVWLGDMLIGEALDVTYESGKSGLTISYDGTGKAIIGDLALDGNNSYAPTTTGVVNKEGMYVSAGGDLPAVAGDPQGNITWKDSGFTAVGSSLTASGTYNARSAVDNTTGGADSAVSATITGGSASIIYANSGNYTGDVWLTIAKDGGASSWFAAHGGSGTLTGNAYLRFTDDAVGGSTVFGAVNATSVTGNVYLELSASNAAFSSFTSGAGKTVALVGSYNTNIGGNVDMVVNSGTLNASVIGGIHTGTKTIGGDVNVFVNGGTINGNVSGGGFTGTINGSTGVTVTYGRITGNVYGGGHGDTINGNSMLRSMGADYASSVVLTGGTIEGDVYGGGSTGTINGNVGVLVDGTAVRLHDGTNWGNIYGGSSGGAVT